MGNVQKGEVAIIGKCGFVGFAELRVSMLCNLEILWPESARIGTDRAPAAGRSSGRGCRQLLQVVPQPTAFRDTENQRDSPALMWLPCVPAAEYLRFISGLSQAYRESQDLSRV